MMWEEFLYFCEICKPGRNEIDLKQKLYGNLFFWFALPDFFQGNSNRWPGEVLRAGTAILSLHGENITVKAKLLTNSDQQKEIKDAMRAKYGICLGIDMKNKSYLFLATKNGFMLKILIIMRNG